MNVKEKLDLIKKRRKENQSVGNETIASSVLEPHPKFSQFLNELFQKNYFFKTNEVSENEKTLEFVQNCGLFLRELKNDQHFNLYMNEISLIVKYLKGFREQSTYLMLLLALCLIEFVGDAKSVQNLIDIILNYPELEHLLENEVTFLANTNREFVEKVYNRFEANKNSPAKFILKFLLKNAHHSSVLFQLVSTNTFSQDLEFGSLILLNLEAKVLPQNNAEILLKLIEISWTPKKETRQTLIKILSQYFSSEVCSLEQLISGQGLITVMSFLHFNKISTPFYNDAEMNQNFRKIWMFFDPKVIKNSVISNFAEIRQFYISLYKKAASDILSNSSSTDEENMDFCLFQKSAFMSFFDLETRLEPDTYEGQNDKEVLEFLNDVILNKNPLIDLNWMVQKIDKIVNHVTIKDDFVFIRSEYEKIVQFLIQNGFVYLNDNKPQMLENMIRYLSFEKFECLLSEIVHNILQTLSSPYQDFVVVYANEFLNMDDRFEGFFKERIEALSEEIFTFENGKNVILAKLEHATKFKLIMLAKLIEKDADLIGLLTSTCEKQVGVFNLVEFCRELLTESISENKEEDQLSTEKVQNLKLLLEFKVLPTE